MATLFLAPMLFVLHNPRSIAAAAAICGGSSAAGCFRPKPNPDDRSNFASH